MTGYIVSTFRIYREINVGAHIFFLSFRLCFLSRRQSCPHSELALKPVWNHPHKYLLRLLPLVIPNNQVDTEDICVYVYMDVSSICTVYSYTYICSICIYVCIERYICMALPGTNIHKQDYSKF